MCVHMWMHEREGGKKGRKERGREKGRESIEENRSTCFDQLTWKMFVFNANPRLLGKVKLFIFAFCLTSQAFLSKVVIKVGSIF